MPSSNRRRYPRFPFHSRANIEFRGGSCDGILKDISLNGALFVPDTPQEGMLLKPCRLHIHYVDEKPVASFNGIVVHIEDGNLFGIKFIGVGEKERIALIHLMELNLAEPKLLDRDVHTLLLSK